MSVVVSEIGLDTTSVQSLYFAGSMLEAFPVPLMIELFCSSFVAILRSAYKMDRFTTDLVDTYLFHV